MEKIWDLRNLLPKLYPNPKMKSRDSISRRINPDGRTRGCHARKRVAFGYKSAAFPRQIFPFSRQSRGGWRCVFVEELYWDSTSSSSYKYPCSATEKSVQSYRAKIRVSSRFSSFVIRVFFLFSREREAYVERDSDVPSSSLPLY